MYEVRVSRGFWAVPTGSLHTVSIPNGEKLVRRALDKLFVPDLVSVGWFKTSFLDELWVSEMHLIIVGAKKDELEKQSRPVGTKVRKKHPYPHWLEPKMFGNHPRGCTCRACTG